MGTQDSGMIRTPTLRSVLDELPRARHLLAPLRDVREKYYGEPLPPLDFPAPALVTEPLPRAEAWALFRELRSDPRLSDVAVVVTTADAEPLAHFWENACPAAEHLLALRTATTTLEATPTSTRARRWVQSAAGKRAIARRAAAAAAGEPASASAVEWMMSLRAGYDRDDVRTVYVIDVEPWASPLALTWLLTPEGWSAVASTLRSWHEAHGFSVVALGADMLEAWVERPPSTDDEIAQRIVECAAFCGGDPDEGFAPVAEMVRRHAWQFRFGI